MMKKFYEINLNEFFKELANKICAEVEHIPVYKGNEKYVHNPDYMNKPFLPFTVIRHIARVIENNPVSPDKHEHPLAYDFYIDRIFAIPQYGEKSGTELLKLICRCAFHDDVLTEAESISIINICHSKEWYKIFKEMNYNDGWN